MPLRIMLDTNIYDRIIEHPALRQLLDKAISVGQVEILRTHIQEDELARIPDPAKRAAVQSVLGSKIVTNGAAFDISGWDEADWGDDSTDIQFEDIARGNPRYAADALIATTAAKYADVLVTEEAKTLPNRIAATGSALQVWTFQQFRAHIESL